MYAIASEIAAEGSPAPNTAAASTASRMPGNANRMSSPDEITASTVPRRQAAITANSVPATSEPITTASGPSIEDCAPTARYSSARLRHGIHLRASGTVFICAPPARRSRRSASKGDPRVEHGVGEIDRDVDHDERADQDQRDALDHRQVLV